MTLIGAMFEKCILDGAEGCFTCKYMYKHHCFVVDVGDLDYLKALFDLNEEFPSDLALLSNKPVVYSPYET